MPTICCSIGQSRLGHERRMQAPPETDFLDHSAKIHSHVRNRHGIGWRKSEFELARTHFNLNTSHRHIHALSRPTQQIKQLLSFAIACFSQILKTFSEGTGCRGLTRHRSVDMFARWIDQFEHLELDFQTHNGFKASLSQLI